MNDDVIEVKDCGNYFTVSNRNGDYKQHAHVDHRGSAYELKRLIERKIVPNGPYFRSCRLLKMAGMQGMVTMALATGQVSH